MYIVYQKTDHHLTALTEK